MLAFQLLFAVFPEQEEIQIKNVADGFLETFKEASFSGFDEHFPLRSKYQFYFCYIFHFKIEMEMEANSQRAKWVLRIKEEEEVKKIFLLHKFDSLMNYIYLQENEMKEFFTPHLESTIPHVVKYIFKKILE